MDTTAVLATIGEVEVTQETVGLAIIGLAALAMGFRWIKAMFF